MDQTMQEIIQAEAEEKILETLRGMQAEVKDPYAKAYISAVFSNGLTGKALRYQINYILNNCQTWRGPRAKEAKAILRENAKLLP